MLRLDWAHRHDGSDTKWAPAGLTARVRRGPDGAWRAVVSKCCAVVRDDDMGRATPHATQPEACEAAEGEILRKLEDAVRFMRPPLSEAQAEAAGAIPLRRAAR